MKDVQKKMHLVSHVHWDPAWYLPYEKYRILLLRLMKKLLRILDEQKEYHSFLFDGQVDAIDDYLLMVPSDQERLAKHIKSGRLIIGPWYIQPEEFLVSGETHIRNLLYGQKRARELGASMMISYLCDMAGHIAQLPQIIQGFGIDSTVGWRGIIDEKERNCSEMIWEAPDGSKVLLKALVGGYYNLIPSEQQGFIDKIDEIKNALTPYTTTDYILIMQGADHREPIENIPSLIEGYNQQAGFEAVEHTTLKHHIDLLKENVTDYPTVKGELRAAIRPHSFILTGILTARMSIKLENERISRDLERWLEPFAAMDSMINNTEYPKELIDYVWKKQLKNSFHDCIYGAHVDEVALDIQNDYKRESEIIEWINGETLHNLSQSIDTTGREHNVTIFNPTPWDKEHAVVDFDFFIEGDQIRKEFVLLDADGNALPYQISDVKKIRKYSGFSNNQWEQNDGRVGHVYSFSAYLLKLPAFGYCNLEVRHVPPIEMDNSEYWKVASVVNQKTDLSVHLNTCENEFLKLTIKDNGLIDIYHKQAGTWYENMNMLEDSGDAGDLYNYSAPTDNMIFYDSFEKARVSIVENGPTKIVYQIERDWMLPKELTNQGKRSDAFVANRVVTKVILKSHAKTVEIQTKLHNCSKDHRVRAVFPTGLSCKSSFSGSQFYVMERATEKEILTTYTEELLGNEPHRLFVDVSDQSKGFSLINRGLPEYEATPKGDLYLTLLRGVGSLSKDTLKERFYCTAGPMYETPMAQELGWQTFEYALYFHEGDWQKGQSYKICDEFYAEPKAMQGDAHKGLLPLSASFVKLSGEGILLSALKKAEEKNQWVIRLYNALNQDTECSLELLLPVKSAYHIDFNEQEIEPLDVRNNQIKAKIKGNQIYTLMMEI